MTANAPNYLDVLRPDSEGMAACLAYVRDVDRRLRPVAVPVLRRVRLTVAHAALEIARVVAPCSVSGKATHQTTGRETGRVLAIGLEPIEVGAALMASGERVVEEFERKGL